MEQITQSTPARGRYNFKMRTLLYIVTTIFIFGGSASAIMAHSLIAQLKIDSHNLTSVTSALPMSVLSPVLSSPEFFGGLPWTLDTSWRIFQQNSKPGSQRLNDSALLLSFCNLAFLASSDIDGCYIQKDDFPQKAALFTLRSHQTSIRTETGAHWMHDPEQDLEPISPHLVIPTLDPVETKKPPLKYFWTWSVPQKGGHLAFGLVLLDKSASGSNYRVGVRVPISALHMDPCSKGRRDFIFGHHCDSFSTKCISEGVRSILNASYDCDCAEYYVPYNPVDAENEDVIQGQLTCVRVDLVTRNVILSVQLVFIILGILLGVATFTQRKTKVLSNSMWQITEVVVFGSILIYLTVIIRGFEEPTATLCILEPWVRELGFAFAYGAIVLKIYRALVEFRTRKAHRWVVREKDIIRYHCAILAVVIFYMSAWTVMSADSYRHISGSICPITWSHRTTEMGELIFLGVGLHMAYHLRNANSPWNERRWYTSAIIIEGLVSIVTIALRETRHLMTSPGEESTFLLILYFARTQASTTLVLLIVFLPKFYYIHEENKKKNLRRGDGGTRIVKALDAINGVGDLDLAEVNLADMDPSDIRTELKRVYTQLELLRNKHLRKDNPHISKRRGGRKPTHRRFSLQKRGSREKALHRKNQRSFRYHGDDNEDSICSIEASTYSEACR